MKFLPVSLAFLGLLLQVAGQDKSEVAERDKPLIKWDVEIPQPVVDPPPAAPVPKPAPIKLKVLSSRTTARDVVESPPMIGLPPVTGRINVTVRRVEDPGLPDRQEPLPALDRNDPAVVARMEELRQKYQEKHGQTTMVFISATVYDRERTFLRIYTSGEDGSQVTAWSNLDFNHFCGVSSYHVKDGVDGSVYDYALLMGIGNQDTERLTELSKKTDWKYEPPEAPPMPDLERAGPAFVLVEGRRGGSAANVLEQIHDLYRKEGKRMEADSIAREKADAERRAYFLANPPKPKDVVVSFWKRNLDEKAPAGKPTIKKTR